MFFLRSTDVAFSNLGRTFGDSATRVQPATAIRNPPARLPVARAQKKEQKKPETSRRDDQGTSKRTLTFQDNALISGSLSKLNMYRDHK